MEDEGDPVALAEARTRTFARRKIYIVSTPTVKGLSRIEREYEASDQRRYMLPCPLCGAFQWLKFSQLKWSHNEPDKAAYECEHCSQLFAEHHKTEMLANGYWQAHAQGDGRTAGFHISSLYSPLGWRSWAEIARAWLDAQGSDASVKSFKNTERKPMSKAAKPEWHRLYDRREDYRIATVPMGGLRFSPLAWTFRRCALNSKSWHGAATANAGQWIIVSCKEILPRRMCGSRSTQCWPKSFTHENGVNLAILEAGHRYRLCNAGGLRLGTPPARR